MSLVCISTLTQLNNHSLMFSNFLLTLTFGSLPLLIHQNRPGDSNWNISDHWHGHWPGYRHCHRPVDGIGHRLWHRVRNTPLHRVRHVLDYGYGVWAGHRNSHGSVYGNSDGLGYWNGYIPVDGDRVWLRVWDSHAVGNGVVLA